MVLHPVTPFTVTLVSGYDIFPPSIPFFFFFFLFVLVNIISPFQKPGLVLILRLRNLVLLSGDLQIKTGYCSMFTP